MTDQRGAAELELVLVTPALVLLLLFVVSVGRLAQARADVDAAARDAARAASIARGPDSARDDGLVAATARLRAGGVTCRSLGVQLDTRRFAPGGSVTANVTCSVDLADLTSLRVPASRTISARFSEPVDTYRGATS
jgi:Flp pilus assembly protein TadG